MSITTLSSRDFNQQVNRAKKAAKHGPVVITDRGKPAHVLLSFVDYQRLTDGRPKIADLLAMPGIETVELDLPRPRDRPQTADFT